MDRVVDKSLIPRGEYCYEIQSIESSKGGTVIKTKRCPFFVFKTVDDGLDWKEAYCNYVEDTSWKLDEQLKICGINLSRDVDLENTSDK